MSRRFLIILYSLCSMLMTISSQTNLKGHVYNSKQNSIQYVTVRLLNKDSIFISGSTTDSLGLFKFNKIQEGSYILAFSSIGYLSKTMPIKISKKENPEINITLFENNVLLKNIEVTANSFARINDHYLITPTPQDVKHAGNGFDLLQNIMIPGIDVDRKKESVTTLGGDVSLYIDGIKADINEIHALIPKEIEKVEYYDMPTGKFSNNIAVINYIIKKKDSGGNITGDATQTLGFQEKEYNLSSKIIKGKFNYSFFSGYKLTKYYGNDNHTEETFYFPETYFTRFSQTDISKTEEMVQYAQFNLQHNTEKHNLMGKITYVRNNQPQNFSSNKLNYINSNLSPTESSVLKDEKSNIYGIDLYGNFNLEKNQNIEVGLHEKFSKNNYSRIYNENTESYKSLVDENVYRTQLSFLYTYKLKKANTFSAQLFHFNTTNMDYYSGDYNKWQHLRNAETLFFLDYSQRLWGKFFYHIHTGASFLQYRLHGNKCNKSINPRFNSQLSYEIDKNQRIIFSCNWANSYPQISTTNNVDQNIDLIRIKRGNPNLDNSQTYNQNIIYNWQKKKIKMQIIAFYQNTHHQLTEDYYLENNKLINSYCSDANSHFFTGIISTSYSASPFLKISIESSWARSIVDGKWNTNQNTWSGTCKLNYYLKDFAFNIYWKSSKKLLDMMTLIHNKQPEKYGLSFLWNHKDLMVDLNIETPFTSHRNFEYWSTYKIYDFHQSLYNKINQQYANIKISYSYGWGKKTKYSQKQLDMYNNSSILKIEN